MIPDKIIDERLAELLASHEQWRQEPGGDQPLDRDLISALRELKQARETMEKLPLTADRVRVVPGIDKVFTTDHPDQSGLVAMEIVPYVDNCMWATFSGSDRFPVASSYSTREAALAASTDAKEAGK